MPSLFVTRLNAFVDSRGRPEQAAIVDRLTAVTLAAPCVYYVFITHKMQHKTYIIYKYNIQVKRTNKKGEMLSKDKTTIKTKVMHVYISTTVLANDTRILRFIS